MGYAYLPLGIFVLGVFFQVIAPTIGLSQGILLGVFEASLSLVIGYALLPLINKRYIYLLLPLITAIADIFAGIFVYHYHLPANQYPLTLFYLVPYLIFNIINKLKLKFHIFLLSCKELRHSIYFCSSSKQALIFRKTTALLTVRSAQIKRVSFSPIATHGLTTHAALHASYLRPTLIKNRRC